MTDPLLDDVKALLDKDFGDDRILKQICRACENNEVISNYERNYVRKLAEKHLGKKPEFTQTPHVEEKHIVADVVMPEIKPAQQIQSLQTEVPRISYSKPKNKKIVFGIGSFALVIIVAAAIAFTGITDGTNFGTSTNNTLISLSIQTDLESYNKKDLISISGVSDTTGNVNLTIENQNNELVWAEQVSLKSDGRFSTLAIAGGQGWENSGTYTIKVNNGKETRSDTFSFTS
ncbi:MAG: hypothetical protein ISR81_01025 [Nitrosopumilus sp.]|nr:hypothetical protein [Nitrosopumilus sp.]MBL7015047.1 hypothetical protein [Nitrosopumilus sp.]MBL7017477.1 hypothetical protein [Nitrosopumilus sp.]